MNEFWKDCKEKEMGYNRESKETAGREREREKKREVVVSRVQ